MNTVIREPLFYIFFVYGVSFLLMSFVVYRGIKNATAIALVGAHYALAMFGLTHGITELIDWVRFIVKTTGNGEIALLKYLSQGFLVASFVVLLQFALNLLTYRSEKKNVVRFVPALLFVVYVAAMFATKTSDILRAGLLARYTFGFAGALLSGIALFNLAKLMKAVVEARAINGLFVTASAFCVYAVVGGLIVTPIAGIPIQLFRAICAVAIAASSFYILGIFKAPEEAPRAMSAGA